MIIHHEVSDRNMDELKFQCSDSDITSQYPISKGIGIPQKPSEPPRLKRIAFTNNNNNNNPMRKSLNNPSTRPKPYGDQDSLHNLSMQQFPRTHTGIKEDIVGSAANSNSNMTATIAAAVTATTHPILSSSHMRFESFGPTSPQSQSSPANLNSISTGRLLSQSRRLKSQLIYSKPHATTASYAILAKDNQIKQEAPYQLNNEISQVTSSKRVVLHSKSPSAQPRMRSQSPGSSNTLASTTTTTHLASISSRFSFSKQKLKKVRHSSQIQQIVTESLISKMNISPGPEQRKDNQINSQQQDQVPQNEVQTATATRNESQNRVRHVSPTSSKVQFARSLDQQNSEIIFENPRDEEAFNKTIRTYNSNFLGRQLTLNNKTCLKGMLDKSTNSKEIKFDAKIYERFTQFMKDNKLNNLIQKNEPSKQQQQQQNQLSSTQSLTGQRFFAQPESSSTTNAGVGSLNGFPDCFSSSGEIPLAFQTASTTTSSAPYLNFPIQPSSKWKYNMNVESKGIAAYASLSTNNRQSPLKSTTFSSTSTRFFLSNNSTRNLQSHTPQALKSLNGSFTQNNTNLPSHQQLLQDSSLRLRSETSQKSIFAAGMNPTSPQGSLSPSLATSSEKQISLKTSKFKKLFHVEDDDQSDAYMIKQTIQTKKPLMQQSPQILVFQQPLQQSSPTARQINSAYSSKQNLLQLDLSQQQQQLNNPQMRQAFPSEEISEIQIKPLSQHRKRFSFEEKYSQQLSQQLGVDLKSCMPKRSKKLLAASDVKSNTIQPGNSNNNLFQSLSQVRKIKLHSFSNPSLPDPEFYSKKSLLKQPIRIETSSCDVLPAFSVDNPAQFVPIFEKLLLSSSKVKSLSSKILAETDLSHPKFIARFSSLVQILMNPQLSNSKKHPQLNSTIITNNQPLFSSAPVLPSVQVRSSFVDIQISSQLQEALLTETVTALKQMNIITDQASISQLFSILKSRLSVVLRISSLFQEFGGQLAMKRLFFYVRDELHFKYNIDLFTTNEEIDYFLALISAPDSLLKQQSQEQQPTHQINTSNPQLLSSSNSDYEFRVSSSTFCLLKQVIEYILSEKTQVRRKSICKILERIESTRWMLCSPDIQSLKERQLLSRLSNFSERRLLAQQLIEIAQLWKGYNDEPTAAASYIIIDALAELISGRLTVISFFEQVLLRRFKMNSMKEVLQILAQFCHSFIFENETKIRNSAEDYQVKILRLCQFERNVNRLEYFLTKYDEGDEKGEELPVLMKMNVQERWEAWLELKGQIRSSKYVLELAKVEQVLQYLFNHANDLSFGIYAAEDMLFIRQQQQQQQQESQFTKYRFTLFCEALRMFLISKGVNEKNIEKQIMHLYSFSFMDLMDE